MPDENVNTPADPMAALIQVLADLAAKLDTTAVQPEALTRAQAARMLGVSLSHFSQMERDGTLGPLSVHVGGERAVRYVRAELVSWLQHGCPPRVRWQAIRTQRKAG